MLTACACGTHQSAKQGSQRSSGAEQRATPALADVEVMDRIRSTTDARHDSARANPKAPR
jgi:hypothetical protein